MELDSCTLLFDNYLYSVPIGYMYSVCHNPPYPDLPSHAFQLEPQLNRSQHKTNSIYEHGNSSMIQLLLYYVITSGLNYRGYYIGSSYRPLLTNTGQFINTFSHFHFEINSLFS